MDHPDNCQCIDCRLEWADSQESQAIAYREELEKEKERLNVSTSDNHPRSA